jgi:hypothetical protein
MRASPVGAISELCSIAYVAEQTATVRAALDRWLLRRIRQRAAALIRPHRTIDLSRIRSSVAGTTRPDRDDPHVAKAEAG